MNNKVRLIIGKYYLYKLLSSMAFFSAVLVPFFTQWGGISLAQTQMLQSWFMFWVFVAEVPTGAVADFLGRKYSMIAGTLVFAIGTVIYSSRANFPIFLLGEFILAVGVALMSGADQALLYDGLKLEGKEGEAKNVFGKAHTISLIGMMIAAPIGSYIASQWGLNYPMLFSAIPYSLAAVIAMTMDESKTYNTVKEGMRYLNVVKEGILYFLHHKLLRKLALNSILVATASYYVIWWYQPLLMKSGIDVAVFGWFHVLLLISEIFVSSQFSRIEKWLGSERAYLKVSALLTGVAFLFAAFIPGVISVVVLLAIGGGFGLTRLEYMSAVINRHVESDKRATVLSSISMFRRFALVPINPILGLLADKSIPLALFIVGLLPIAVVAAPFLMMKRFKTK